MSIGLVFALLLGQTCPGADVSIVSTSIVYLLHQQIETVTNKTEVFEVWLKNVATGNATPKIAAEGGTGAIVSRNAAFYIITARHVAKMMEQGDNSVALGGNGDKTVVVPLAGLQGTNTNGWIHHPIEDVSILPISPPPGSLVYSKHFLDFDSFYGATTNVPDRNIELTIVGFALGKGWGHNQGEEFSPLSRKTRAASGLLHDDEFGEFYLLEDPSVQGYSGAPIFDFGEPLISSAGITGGGRPTGCYGILSFTANDNTGGKMAGVVPTKFVMELIHKYESRR